MGSIFTLEDSVKEIITLALDDLIIELGKKCRLVYPPKMLACDNCVYDPIGRKSTNKYLHGGPIPFSNTSCPMCDGTSQRAEAKSEVVTFLCALDPKKFFVPIPNLDLKVPHSVVQTKGWIKDLPKVKRASHMEFQIDIEDIISKRYKLRDDPADVGNIIQGRYFVATWEQIK